MGGGGQVVVVVGAHYFTLGVILSRTRTGCNLYSNPEDVGLGGSSLGMVLMVRRRSLWLRVMYVVFYTV